MSEKRKPHGLVFHKHEDGAPTWDCESCGQTVLTQVDGGDLLWVIEAQRDHECPNDAARERLPRDVEQVRKLLEDRGVCIRIHWTGYEDAELELVDVKTNVSLRLGSEELG